MAINKCIVFVTLKADIWTCNFKLYTLCDIISLCQHRYEYFRKTSVQKYFWLHFLHMLNLYHIKGHKILWNWTKISSKTKTCHKIVKTLWDEILGKRYPWISSWFSFTIYNNVKAIFFFPSFCFSITRPNNFCVEFSSIKSSFFFAINIFHVKLQQVFRRKAQLSSLTYLANSCNLYFSISRIL